MGDWGGTKRFQPEPPGFGCGVGLTWVSGLRDWRGESALGFGASTGSLAGSARRLPAKVSVERSTRTNRPAEPSAAMSRLTVATSSRSKRVAAARGWGLDSPFMSDLGSENAGLGRPSPA